MHENDHAILLHEDYEVYSDNLYSAHLKVKNEIADVLSHFKEIAPDENMTMTTAARFILNNLFTGSFPVLLSQHAGSTAYLYWHILY